MRIVALLVAPAYHPFHRCESIDQYWMRALSLTELHGPIDQLRREYSRGILTFMFSLKRAGCDTLQAGCPWQG